MSPEKKIIHLTQNSPFESSYSTFTTLCSHHHDLISEQFYHPPPKKASDPLKAVIPYSPSSSPWQPLTYVLFVSTDLPLWNISYKQNHNMWLFSLSIVLLRFTHVVVFVSASFCFLFFHEKAFIRSFSIHSFRHCSQWWDPHVSSSLDFSGERQTRNKSSRLWASADSWTRTSWEKGTTWLFYTKWSRKGTLRK